MEKSKKLENEYRFFRSLVKNNIFNLTDVKEQRKMSSWLQKCDTEEDESIKCGIIKLMLASLQHPGGNIGIFKHTAPKRLPYLENTPIALYELLETMLIEELEADSTPEGDEVSPLQTVAVAAAVSSDMTSLATRITDAESVQVFYARSDRSIDTWNLPKNVQFPVDSRSPSRWERTLSTPPKTAVDSILDLDAYPTAKMPTLSGLKTFIPLRWYSAVESEFDLVIKNCNEVVSDQTSKVVDTEFSWYEHSTLDGFLRLNCDECVDEDTCQYENKQLELDEQAVKVWQNRQYPDRVRFELHPRLISEVTGTDLESTDRGRFVSNDTDKRYCISCRENDDDEGENKDVWTQIDARDVGESYEDVFGRSYRTSGTSCFTFFQTPTYGLSNFRCRAGSDNPSRKCASEGKSDGCRRPRSQTRRTTAAQQPAIWESDNPLPPLRTAFREQLATPNQRPAQTPNSRIPVACQQPDRSRRPERSLHLYEGSRLPVPSYQASSSVRIPRPNRPVCCNQVPQPSRERRRSHDAPDPNASESCSRRGTYDAPEPNASQSCSRRGTYDASQSCSGRGTLNASQSCSGRGTYDAPEPNASQSCSRRGTYDVSEPRVAQNHSRSISCDAPRSGDRQPRRTPCDSARSTDRRRNGGRPEDCAAGGRRGTFTINGTVQMDDMFFPEIVASPRQPDAGRRSSSPGLDDYLDNAMNFDTVAPRSLAVPGCPYVRIDESVSGPSTPEHWRSTLDNRSSIGSQPMSIDLSPVYDDSFGRRSNVSSGFSGPRSANETFYTPFRESRPFDSSASSYCNRSAACPRAASVDRDAPCRGRRRITFDRKTR